MHIGTSVYLYYIKSNTYVHVSSKCSDKRISPYNVNTRTDFLYLADMFNNFYLMYTLKVYYNTLENVGGLIL